MLQLPQFLDGFLQTILKLRSKLVQLANTIIQMEDDKDNIRQNTTINQDSNIYTGSGGGSGGGVTVVGVVM